jgi:hypothetical protein
MTKNQKRTAWKHLNTSGTKERGHDWVDIISHVSVSGEMIDSDRFL